MLIESIPWFGAAAAVLGQVIAKVIFAESGQLPNNGGLLA
jgi:hypothetical protein